MAKGPSKSHTGGIVHARTDSKHKQLASGAMIRSYFGEGRGSKRHWPVECSDLSLKERVRNLVRAFEGTSVESELELQEAGKRWLHNKSKSFAKPTLKIGKTRQRVKSRGQVKKKED